MQRKQRSGRWVMTTMLMMVLAGVFSDGPARADPDFTDVTDILAGRPRYLLRNDHLIVGMQYCANGVTSNCAAGSVNGRAIDLRTSDSSIASSGLIREYGPHSQVPQSTAVSVGPGLEWYQPPWEPGNVVSYPASVRQLEMLYPDMHVLSKYQTWYTDASVLLQKTTWAAGTSQCVTSGSQQTFEEDVSASVVGQFSFGVGSFGSSLSLSGSSSDSTASLSTGQTAIGISEGIGVQKPGSFADPTLYQYTVTPVIFGQMPPTGDVNTQPALPTDIKTSGILRTAFLADPTDPSAGGWWQQAYSLAPDVALNHPSRWQITTQSVSPIPANCLSVDATNSTVQCATLAAARPTNPWLSPFHYMRGFFITHDGAYGKGPQLETATAGDKLALQARVYNYSLASMPVDALVHVRFYAQPLNPNKTPKGDSVLIGEDTLAPIPPFSSDGPLNWVLAHTTFDTTPYADQYLAFWVVVWMQQPAGLVAEIPGHGLTGLPGALKSLADTAPLTETYSNNVGFYKFPFYVSPPLSSTELELPSRGRSTLRLGTVRLSSRKVDLGTDVEVRPTLLTGRNSVPGATVLFYDGDPDEGGRVFDMERVAHLRSYDQHHVRVLFSPDRCGQHQIFVTVSHGKPFERAGKSATLRVTCGNPGDKAPGGHHR